MPVELSIDEAHIIRSCLQQLAGNYNNPAQNTVDEQYIGLVGKIEELIPLYSDNIDSSVYYPS